MAIIKGITLAVMTLTLHALIACQAVTEKPPPQDAPLSRPTGIETPQDSALSKVVKEKLLAEQGVNLTRVIVQTRKGTIYLSGVVPSLEARERAVKISWRVPGVQTVVNHLQVGE
jgi:hyperosmotically inducible periplasmic protein